MRLEDIERDNLNSARKVQQQQQPQQGVSHQTQLPQQYLQPQQHLQPQQLASLQQQYLLQQLYLPQSQLSYNSVPLMIIPAHQSPFLLPQDYYPQQYQQVLLLIYN